MLSQRTAGAAAKVVLTALRLILNAHPQAFPVPHALGALTADEPSMKGVTVGP